MKKYHKGVEDAQRFIDFCETHKPELNESKGGKPKEEREVDPLADRDYDQGEVL